jgi:hypothetical protein
MVQPFDMLDFVEGKVERREFGKGIEPFDMRYQVVIEIDFCESGCDVFGYRDAFYAVLAQAKTL